MATVSILALKIDRRKELRINPVFTLENVFRGNQIAKADEEHFFTEECHQNVGEMIGFLKLTLLPVLMKELIHGRLINGR